MPKTGGITRGELEAYIPAVSTGNINYPFSIYVGRKNKTGYVANVIGKTAKEVEAYAKLIVTTINQCQAVNPDHPEYVAEKIGEMAQALQTASMRIHNSIRYEKDADYRQMLRKDLDEIESVLRKIHSSSVADIERKE
jgi:hypothetical protein